MRLEIVDIGHGGVGIARHDGRVVFVRGAIPGEVVDVEVVSRQSKFFHANVVDVVEASPHRVEHPWAAGAAGVTGAADFGHVELAWQRKLKTDVVAHNLRRIGGQDLAEAIKPLRVEVRGVDSADGWGTRTRFDVVKMATGVGMYMERTNRLVPLDRMPLALPELEHLDLFGNAWDGVVAEGERMHVVCPASGPDVVVAGQTYTAPGRQADPFIHERAVTGADVFEYRISSGGFWQIHCQAPSVLLQAVLKGAAAQEGESVLELFSGAGLFTVPLARAVGERGSVFAIEGSERAVRDASVNLASMPWAKAEVARIDEGTVAGLRADVVVADPPRAGLGKKTAAQLARCGARRIVLVSCDPAAMARDVAELVANGRKVEAMEAFDIFPHTHHMEVVTALS
ncbi:class I SAM-dependent RNA methyltransferase [Trueperella pecoris]|uniref:Class I SAM-dependent RNA methyltransferase n=1 Tax=Trueperella pecoris TaxID=2733571 RepID=A0A7M1QX03_9ACTO|nr:class I SAM-dependent RNA methyltransferase [Trueperella pecoris]QOQ38905.1 class I SAM-dependent RNA methyltransferase [Trueperella pecoris]QOR46468.1 class I SAM-dependent RNA methyltransferase [Trueperella pecoris]QTG76294.1 class I SAM-dependent RNA methyltransferase [Trueperella pecoris]